PSSCALSLHDALPILVARLRRELFAARPHVLEGDDLGQALDRVHGVGVEVTGDGARAGAESIDAGPAEDRAQRRTISGDLNAHADRKSTRLNSSHDQN